MLKTFSDVKKFSERNSLPPATSTKLLQVLDDPAKTKKLKIKIATTVDAMEPWLQQRVFFHFYKWETESKKGETESYY